MEDVSGKLAVRMKTTLLKEGSLVTPTEVVRGDILLRDGRLILNPGQTDPDEVVDVTGKYIVPGFVETHVHGYGSFDFSAGFYDAKKNAYDASPEAFQRGFALLCRRLSDFGVTRFYIGNASEPIADLRNYYAQLSTFLTNTKPSGAAAKLMGGFLEGPFLNPEMAGATNPERVRRPSIEEFERINDQGSIKLANVVPDYGEGSIALIEHITSKGIVVGAGHTHATADQFADAIKAGLKYCIHYTNGPTGGSYKPFGGGGAIEAVLRFDSLYAELICDGYHINPAYIRDIIKRKGIDRIIAITDCTFIAGSDIKEFTSSGIAGKVSDNGQYLQVVGKRDVLFGSNLTMDRGFANMLNWLTVEMDGIWNREHRAMKFEEALIANAKMFSSNPCVLTGLDAAGYGSIIDHARADLCVLGIVGTAGKYEVTVEATIVDGNRVK